MAKVLIVDDDPVHRMLIGRLAEQVGLKTGFASTAHDAIEKLSQEDFCAMTLDLNLGEDDGTDVLEYLADRSIEMRVFVISGSERSQYEAAVNFGVLNRIDVVDFPKPIQLPYLRECLAQVATI